MPTFGDETFSQKIDRILQLSEENNRMLRAMRRDKWLGLFAKMAIWAVVLIASYFFAMQFITPLLDSVQQIQNVTSGFTGTKSTSTVKASSTTPSQNDFQKVLDIYNQYKGSLPQ